MSDQSENPEPVVGETIPFSVPSEYSSALERVLALATEEILIFDRDLQQGDWGSLERAEMLRSFLLSHRRTRIQIVVHETLHIERYLARIVGLLRDFSHKMGILRTVDDGRNAWDGFVLVDHRHLVHRFHLDSMRGELSIDHPQKVRELRERYDELLVHTEPGLNATPFGL